MFQKEVDDLQDDESQEENFEMLQQTEHQAGDKKGRLELPPFWCDEVEVWFTGVEAQFERHNIDADEIKYNAVIAHLGQDSLAAVEYLVSSPPKNDKYLAIKEALVANYTVSVEGCFKKLASLELGDKRPSEMLAEIIRLGGNKLDPAFVRGIWMERMPAQIQMILLCKTEEDNYQLAQLANKMMEIQRNADKQAKSTEDHTKQQQKNSNELIEKASTEASKRTRDEDESDDSDSEDEDYIPDFTRDKKRVRNDASSFWSDQVKLWFIAVEAQFKLDSINADATKYNAVIARLNQEALNSVHYLISNPPENEKYLALKEALIAQFTVSEECGFKMLASVKLGKRRPSEMLAKIIRLGGNKLDPVHARAIWLERLPPQIQMILLCKGEEDNNQLAKLANKLMEIQRNAAKKEVDENLSA